MYYKITKANMTSSVMDYLNVGLVTQYKLNEFVYANEDLFKLGYGLFVFDNLDDATKHAFADRGDRIFEVEILEPLNYFPRIFYFGVITAAEILSVNDLHLHEQAVPKGTVIVKAVKLMRELCITK